MRNRTGSAASARSRRWTRDFQRRQREFREDLNQRRNEELSAVLEKANRAIKEIAEREKFDLILQEAVYVSPRIDITDQVVKTAQPSRKQVGALLIRPLACVDPTPTTGMRRPRIRR